MKILFVNLSALKFTVATPDSEPLGGSESALCYLARALARRGHDVSVIANLPEPNAGIIEKISHYSLASLKDAAFFSTGKFDVIILCNVPAAAAPLKILSPMSRLIFWAHVLPDQPSMQILTQPQAKETIDATVFVSKWQQGEVERVFGVMPEAAVIGNGIAPVFENMFTSPEALLNAKQNRAAYTTTPYRGLSVLLRAMEGFDRPTALDVFSSMRVYQAGDEDYAALFQRAAQNPVVTCRGSVTQRELAQQLRGDAFLFYPCIYPETFCITALEAIASGMKVVATRLGALADTTRGFADLIPISSRDGDTLAADFRESMQGAVDDFTSNPQAWAQERFDQSRRINETCTWSVRAEAWEELLASLF